MQMDDSESTMIHSREKDKAKEAWELFFLPISKSLHVQMVCWQTVHSLWLRSQDLGPTY